MPKKIIVRTGTVYGYYTVQKEVTTNDGKRRFICKCECGTVKEVDFGHLRNGRTQSCGCRKGESRKTVVKAGDVYGRYMIQKEVTGLDSRHRRFRCKCECGTVKDVMLDHLRSGKIQSCGCLHSEIIKYPVSIGAKYNRLTVVKELPTYRGVNMVKCKCSCGKTIETDFYSVRAGRAKSCGCYQLDSVTTHGLKKHYLYDVWKGMIRRCHNKNDPAYHNYGARSIIVCKEWRDPKTGLQAFVAWEKSLPNGKEWKPGYEIDRKDNSKGYMPDNCWFGTTTDNGRNKRDTLMVVVPIELTDDEFESIKHLCCVNNNGYYEMPFIDLWELKGKGLKYHTAYMRLKYRRWTPIDAVTKTVK
jgi:hypothetical protein